MQDACIALFSTTQKRLRDAWEKVACSQKDNCVTQVLTTTAALAYYKLCGSLFPSVSLYFLLS